MEYHKKLKAEESKWLVEENIKVEQRKLLAEYWEKAR